MNLERGGAQICIQSQPFLHLSNPNSSLENSNYYLKKKSFSNYSGSYSGLHNQWNSNYFLNPRIHRSRYLKITNFEHGKPEFEDKKISHVVVGGREAQRHLAILGLGLGIRGAGHEQLHNVDVPGFGGEVHARPAIL